MSKRSVLIVEDDHDLGDMLVTYFDTQGYTVFHALSGATAIQLARSKFPNVILLDVMLPDMDGFEVCRVLRTTTVTKYIPIMFLTQRDARSDKVAGLQIGADDYITKPFDIEELRLRIERSIKRATRDHLHETRTGLPTGNYIDSEYHNIADKDGWHAFQVRIAGYDAFRDVYGFLISDDAITLGATILKEGLFRYGTPKDFIGITKDNVFVVFTCTNKLEKFKQFITDNFADRARTLYCFEDVDRGHMLVEREGQTPQKVSLMQFKLEAYEPATTL